MLKFAILVVSVAVGLVTLDTTLAGGPSLKDQTLALDKELAVMRRATQSDPEVKAARAELQLALDKLNATVDAVMVRTNPRGKELLDKRKELVEQYKAQQKAASPKPVAK